MRFSRYSSRFLLGDAQRPLGSSGLDISVGACDLGSCLHATLSHLLPTRGRAPALARPAARQPAGPPPTGLDTWQLWPRLRYKRKRSALPCVHVFCYARACSLTGAT